MNLSVFPHENHYFNAGLEALKKLKKSHTPDLHAVIVVTLSQWSLKEVVSSSWMTHPGSEKIIIIYNSQLLPLAMYYKIKNSNILLICQESESLKALSEFFREKKYRDWGDHYNKPHLTENEFISLRFSLNGVSAKEQAQEMGVSTKTAFALRYTLANKLQVKKLSHLASPLSRNFRSYGLRTPELSKRTR